MHDLVANKHAQSTPNTHPTHTQHTHTHTHTHTTHTHLCVSRSRHTLVQQTSPSGKRLEQDWAEKIGIARDCEEEAKIMRKWEEHVRVDENRNTRATQRAGCVSAYAYEQQEHTSYSLPELWGACFEEWCVGARRCVCAHACAGHVCVRR